MSPSPSADPRPVTRDILIVDDESSVSTLLTFAIERIYTDRSVRVVCTAEDALALTQRERFSLLIVDRHLPGADGLQLVKRMRAAVDETPVILVTGNYTEELEAEARRLQISACFSKPFFVREIMQAVTKTVGSPGAQLPKREPEPRLRVQPDAPGREGRVLVVDDDRSVQALLVRVLTENGHQVVIAENAGEALKRAAEHRPDAVLVDVNLPQTDGLKLVAALKKTDPTVSVVLITATPELVDFRPADALTCLAKPFRSLSMLGATVKEACRLGRQKSAEPLQTSA